MTHPWGRTVYLPPIYEGLTFMVNVWANFPKHVTRFRTKVGFQNQGSWNGTQFFRGGGVDQPRCKQLMVILWLIFLQKLICLGGGFKYLLFSPRNLGMMIQFDEQIFQICWNHQLLVVWVIIEGKNQRPSFMVDSPWDFEGKVVFNPIWIGCSNKAGHGKNVPQAVFSRWILELQAQVPNHGLAMDILGSSPNQDTSHHQDYNMF